MNTNATVDTPANVPAPTTPELIASNWDEDGLCTDAELVKIPMPKGCICTLSLAADGDGLWYHGCSVQADGAGSVLAGRPSRRERAYTSRANALGGALAEAREYFARTAKGKKAVSALEFFAERNGCEFTPATGSPANTGADASDGSDSVAAPARGEYLEIPVSAVSANPANHRKVFDEAAIEELAESIRREGLLQPIAVRVVCEEQLPGMENVEVHAERYELILGERRWRAHKFLKAEMIQAKVYRGLDARRAKVLALIENLQRVQLNAVEEAEGFADLAAEGLTQEAIAQRVGRSRPVVANALRLLKLPSEALDFIREGKLTAAHGVALARFDGWPVHQTMMAALAVREETRAGEMEKGVPFHWQLVKEKLAVSIHSWGEYKVTDRLKKMPMYFAQGDGDWVCFDPSHWESECAERKRQAELRAATEAKKREEEIAKSAKSSRKQLSLADLDSGDYRQFKDGAEAALLELVPDDKKAMAKGHEGKVAIVTDVALADRLKAAMGRVIKKDRKAKCEDLGVKVRKKIAALKKVGPREMAWVVYSLATYDGRSVQLHLEAEAAAAVGVKLPKAFAETEGDSYDAILANRKGMLEHLAGVEGVDLVKVLMEERLVTALEELVDSGPDCIGARMLRWWLDSDTLWLLEETDEGRAELLDQVKNAPWYKAMAGSAPVPGDVVLWGLPGKEKQGVVISPEEWAKANRMKFAKEWVGNSSAVKVTIKAEASDGDYVVVENKGLRVVGAPEGEE